MSEKELSEFFDAVIDLEVRDSYLKNIIVIIPNLDVDIFSIGEILRLLRKNLQNQKNSIPIKKSVTKYLLRLSQLTYSEAFLKMLDILFSMETLTNEEITEIIEEGFNHTFKGSISDGNMLVEFVKKYINNDILIKTGIYFNLISKEMMSLNYPESIENEIFEIIIENDFFLKIWMDYLTDSETKCVNLACLLSKTNCYY